ncbi:hypothetical protein BH09PLA1_BH09PLA1_37770 [soil metagenome]
MSVSEHDLELLETYLDNELAADDMESIRGRLKREPALAIALDQLTRDRQLRHQVYFAMDREVAPTARAATESIGRSLHRAALREASWNGRRLIFRQICAAAACIVVGLLVGWFGRERADFQPQRTVFDKNSRAALNPDATTVSMEKPARNGFNLAITDDFGRVLAQQHFDTLDEARQFSSDLALWQNRQREIRNGGVRLIGGKF